MFLLIKDFIFSISIFIFVNVLMDYLTVLILLCKYLFEMLYTSFKRILLFFTDNWRIIFVSVNIKETWIFTTRKKISYIIFKCKTLTNNNFFCWYTHHFLFPSDNMIILWQENIVIEILHKFLQIWEFNVYGICCDGKFICWIKCRFRKKIV